MFMHMGLVHFSISKGRQAAFKKYIYTPKELWIYSHSSIRPPWKTQVCNIAFVWRSMHAFPLFLGHACLNKRGTRAMRPLFVCKVREVVVGSSMQQQLGFGLWGMGCDGILTVADAG
jgi:hypothetical protein